MNPRIASLQASLIRQVHERKRPGDIDLGLGQPVMKPDVDPFRRAVDWIAEHGCPYSPIAGFPELREAVGCYVNADSDRVVITHGSEEALYVGLRIALDPATDRVLLVEPCYPAYEKICQMEGIGHAFASCSPDRGFEPRAADVLDRLTDDTRLVVLASPSNPTGRVWSAPELRALAKGLGDRWVLWDEVYRELYYTDERPPSITDFHERTLVTGGLSKSHAVTGLRLGWLITTPDTSIPAQRAHQLINTSASTLSQRVALEILREPGRVAETRAMYAARRAALLESLRRHDVEGLAPDGAFYCMVRIPPGPDGAPRDSLKVAADLLDVERVAAVPGIAFGPASEGWLRVSWVPDPQVVDDGLKRMSRFFKQWLFPPPARAQALPPM